MPPDLYTELLDIPEGTRPPDCYTLLGLPLYENAPEAIRKAVLAQTAKVRRHALDPDRERAQRIQELLNEIGRARTILGDPQRKSRHDDLMIARQFGFEVPPESAPAKASERHRLCPDCGARMEQRQRTCIRCGWEAAEQVRDDAGKGISALQQARVAIGIRLSQSRAACVRAVRRVQNFRHRPSISAAGTTIVRRAAMATAALVAFFGCMVVLVKMTAAMRADREDQRRAYAQAMSDAHGAVEREDWATAATALSVARENWQHGAAIQQLSEELQRARTHAALRNRYEGAVAEARRHKAWRRWEEAVVAAERAIATGWPDTTIAELLKEDAQRLLVKSDYETTVDLGGGVNMAFCWVPATTSEEWKALSDGQGFFIMGSPPTEQARGRTETEHRVRLSLGFWLGKYEVTQKQWQHLMGSNRSHHRGENKPVEMVSWHECQEFIAKLNRINTRGSFRLPTEAEWEYACRAGTTTPFCYGNDLDVSMADFNGDLPYGDGKRGQNRKTTVAVGSFPSNAWGLHDMHGNVSEWCQDGYGDYPSGDAVDPKGSPEGYFRVFRGGSYRLGAERCRSAHRNRVVSTVNSYAHLGFRVVQTSP